MPRGSFTFRISDEEKKKLRIVAKYMNRTCGDALRVMIVEFANSLEDNKENDKDKN